MEQNVVVSLFEVEREAYQAISELKKIEGNEKSCLLQAVLVKKENGALKTLESFDTGVNTLDDMAKGGLIGAVFGILGGPIGVLLGGSYGALVGSMVDSDDALAGVSMLEQIAGKLDDNDLAVILLANEEDESVLDQEFAKFKTITARFDAAVVAAEVDEARKMEQEMARLARKELRDQKKADRKKKIEDRKAKNAAAFAAFKEKHKKNKE